MRFVPTTSLILLASTPFVQGKCDICDKGEVLQPTGFISGAALDVKAEEFDNVLSCSEADALSDKIKGKECDDVQKAVFDICCVAPTVVVEETPGVRGGGNSTGNFTGILSNEAFSSVVFGESFTQAINALIAFFSSPAGLQLQNLVSVLVGAVTNTTLGIIDPLAPAPGGIPTTP